MTIKFENFKEKENVFKIQTGHTIPQIYDKYNNKLIYYISKLCGDQQMAEDLAINTFIRSLEKIDQYDKSKGAFSTWLFTIGRNLTFFEIKESKTSSSIDLHHNTQGTTLKEFIANDEIDEDQELIILKGNIIKKHMENLKEPYREIMQMRELDKLSYTEISEQLGENLNTVKSRIKNGRMLIIKSSKPEFDLLNKIYNK